MFCSLLLRSSDESKGGGLSRKVRRQLVRGVWISLLWSVLVGGGIGLAAQPGENGPLVVSTGGEGLYIVDVDGSRELLAAGQIRLPDFSPDGRQLVANEFLNPATGSGALRIIEVATGAIETYVESDAAEAVWSGDGKRIAYLLESSGQRDLWVGNADGTGHRLVRENVPKLFDWASNDDRVLIAETDDLLYSFGIDTAKKVFVGTSGGFLTDADFSPDGSQVIYIGNALPYLANADGSGSQLFVAPQVGDSYRYATWSPDGSRVVVDKVIWSEDMTVEGTELVVFDAATRDRLHVIEDGGSLDWGPAAKQAPPSGFRDVSADHVFATDIEWLAAAGITRGCNPPTNDLFCPDDFVTRGQMAAFLVRALSYGGDGGGDLFVDDDGSVFEADIDRLAAAGITRGCNPPKNTRFCPDDVVTRGQMAAFLVRALGYTDDGGGDLFVDDNDSLFESDIDLLGTAGVTRGCNPPVNDRFCPNDPVNRGQMAAFLHRAIDS